MFQSYSDALRTAKERPRTPQQRTKVRARMEQRGRRVAQRSSHIHPVSPPQGSGVIHFSRSTYSSSVKQQKTVLSSGIKQWKTPSNRSTTKERPGAGRRQKVVGNRRMEVKEWSDTAVKGGLCSQENSGDHKDTQVTEAAGPDCSSTLMLPPSSFPRPKSLLQCSDHADSVQ